jgi:predicted DNA-binding protein (UPF0251 family)
MLLRFIRRAVPVTRLGRLATQNSELEAHRMVVLEGRSYSEAASVLAVSEGEIQTRVLRMQKRVAPGSVLSLD